MRCRSVWHAELTQAEKLIAAAEALAPVRDLWRMSIEPLIDQYLQGVDADSRRTALARLEKVFLIGSK